MRRYALLAVSLIAALAAGPAVAQGLDGYSKQERADALRFAVNNSLFTLYHEVAHLLVDRLHLPVLGREEDAADNMATWMLLEQKTPAANQTLEDAAWGWTLTGENYGNYFTDDDYASGYSPDRQRSLQIVCLMVGADGSAFRAVAESYSIQPDRQHTCAFDYETLDRSMRAILPEAEAGTKVDVRYHDAGRRLRVAERAFRSSGIFDDVAEEVRQNYKIADRVRFTARSCGEPNAYYDPATIEVIFCYELMQDFIDLYAADRPPMRR